MPRTGLTSDARLRARIQGGIFCAWILFAPILLMAAVPQRPLKQVFESNMIAGSGVIRGGAATAYFSILDVRRSASAKVERLVIDLGDVSMRPYNGKPAYFSIELKDKPQKLIIDLAQTLNAKIDEKKLQQIMMNSKFIKAARLGFEPGSQTMTLTMDLKKTVNLRAIPVDGKSSSTAKLVVDLSEKK